MHHMRALLVALPFLVATLVATLIATKVARAPGKHFLPPFRQLSFQV